MVEIKLGDKVRDTASGFTGNVTARCEFLGGETTCRGAGDERGRQAPGRGSPRDSCVTDVAPIGNGGSNPPDDLYSPSRSPEHAAPHTTGADGVSRAEGAWAIAARMAKEQRKTTALMWLARVGQRFPAVPPYLVTFTRIGPRRCDYSNVVASFKHVQDEVAARLGVDDGDEDKIRFVYAQKIGAYAVRIEIRTKETEGP